MKRNDSIAALVLLGIAFSALLIGRNLESRSQVEYSVEVDSRLEPYFEEWRQEMKGAGLNPDPALARLQRVEVCRDCKSGYSEKGRGRIGVSERQLELGPYSTRGTLWHELGHFVFDLEHGSCGIMRHSSWREEEYWASWSGFKEEYINECRKNRYEAEWR